MVMEKTEDQEQEALFEYAALQKEIEWSGVQNWSAPLPVVRGSYPGLFIEMKSEKGVVQKNQKAWHDTLRAQGYKVEVCRGCGEAVRTIRDYFER